MRLLLALFVALVVAAPAQAATRAVQAYDTPTFRTVWWPSTLPAQVGDTVQFRLTQPGNANASTHDVWIVAPGGSATRLGASYEAPSFSTTVGAAGAWQFYCSIHGGLAEGGMNGVVNVGTADPGPPVDPGTPWTTGEEPPDPNALPNDTTTPGIFEEGDNTPPTLKLLKATPTDKGAKAKIEVAEPVTLTLRLKKGKRVLATKRVEIAAAGTETASIALPKRLQDRPGRYRLQVWATDSVDLDSPIKAAWIEFRP